MSILSFNHFDFSLMLGKVEKEKKDERMHKSRFWRQIIYNFIVLAAYLGYNKTKYFVLRWFDEVCSQYNDMNARDSQETPERLPRDSRETPERFPRDS